MKATTVLTILIILANTTSYAKSIRYPDTRRVDHIDTYHGTDVADPYRWLEDDVRKSEDVASWVEAQNKVTFKYLNSIKARNKIERRLTELWNYEKLGTPFKKGGRYYFYKNDGLQNQSVLYVQKTLDDEPEILIDPNTWSDDGTVSMAGATFSDDGRYVAYGVRESGSDWRTRRVMEIETRGILDEKIEWIKYSDVTWTRDSRGFFYARYDEPSSEGEFQNLTLNQKLYYHRIGTQQSDDVLVYQNPDHPEWAFGSDASLDGRFLVISIWKGTDDRNIVLHRDLTEPYGMPITLIEDFENEFSFLGNDGEIFYFRTDLNAPNLRVVAIDIRHPEERSEIIPEADEPLKGINMVANTFVARYLKDATSRVKIYSLRGELIREVDLPGIGRISGFGGRRTDTETFYSFQSFATPLTTYQYDVITGKSTLLRRTRVQIDPDAYETRQVFYESKDGTRVPMFIVNKKGIVLDGSHPTLLYGYGGFNISMLPGFSISRLAWIELGGIFAMPNIRGGGEYGQAWHEGGKKANKQNVFDDFIAAAEWLIQNRYTRPDKLAIQGGSNGGLLVGAVMTQRPDLFGACLPAVGVMDMLRFHKWTAGRFWVDDFGSSDNPEEFKTLLSYSPYHNLEPANYPPTLVTTADTDDRVVPGHSFKFAAALQVAQQDRSAPTLIRIESKAGHGGGTPTSKVIARIADQWAFLVENLGVKLP